MNEPDFPDGFQGAGPMFAAIPADDRWLALIRQGITTYAVPDPAPDDDPCAERWCHIFLDCADAEAAADARDGIYICWDGPAGTGSIQQTPARAEAERQAEAAYADMLAGPEWPSDLRMASEADARGGTGSCASFDEWLAGGQAPEAGS
jgi:hypothetical protein